MTQNPPPLQRPFSLLESDLRCQRPDPGVTIETRPQKRSGSEEPGRERTDGAPEPVPRAKEADLAHAGRTAFGRARPPLGLRVRTSEHPRRSADRRGWACQEQRHRPAPLANMFPRASRESAGKQAGRPGHMRPTPAGTDVGAPYEPTRGGVKLERNPGRV